MYTIDRMLRLPIATPPSIPPAAQHVWQTLRRSGYECLFAGGWVRDLWMGKESCDVDLATSATPEEVIALFERCLPLGQRFGSVVVLVEGQEGIITGIEVTTFRRDGTYEDGRRPTTIEPSSPIEDAKRRDFTINGLFFDPDSCSIIDYVGGIDDLRLGILRAIGDPWERFREDRLRILRGVRLSTRLAFTLDEPTRLAMMSYSSSLIECVSVERIWQEIEKMHDSGHLVPSLLLMSELKMLAPIFGLEITALELLNRLHPLQPQAGWSPIHILAKMWHLRVSPSESSSKSTRLISLDPGVNQLYKLKISNRDRELLAHLNSGLKLYSEDRELYEPLTWIRWLQHPEGQLNCLWISNSLQDSQWYQQTEQLRQTPVAQLLIQQSTVVRAGQLAQFQLLPTPKLGQLLNWLSEQAARMQIVDIPTLLKHLASDPEGMKLLQQAKGPNLVQKPARKK